MKKLKRSEKTDVEKRKEKNMRYVKDNLRKSETEISKKRLKKSLKKFPTLNLKTEHDIAMDFAVKSYKQFDKAIKSIILFGSTAKRTSTSSSDIDIILVIDDVSISWDQEMIAWYRTELEKILKGSPYSKDLHINTVKLSTWWADLLRGDPIIINIIRYGEAMIDAAGFFEPLKYLLINGKIRSTPEAIYNALQRAPMHLRRSKTAELAAIEGLHWAMVDSAHAALISANVLPPSPEHIAIDLKETFSDRGLLKTKYLVWYRDLYELHKKITHGEINDLKGVEIDEWQVRTEEFLSVMTELVKNAIE